jgi:hypothetical protein
VWLRFLLALPEEIIVVVFPGRTRVTALHLDGLHHCQGAARTFRGEASSEVPEPEIHRVDPESGSARRLL